MLETRLRDIQVLVGVLRGALGTPDGVGSPLGCDLMAALVAQAEQLPALAEAGSPSHPHRPGGRA